MQYEEFLEEIKRIISKKAAGLQVSVVRVLKANCERADSLTIREDGANLSPAIHMGPYYQQFKQGLPLEEAAERIWRTYEENSPGGRVDFSFYMDFSKIKDNLACRLINYERNRSLLEQIPHRQFLDLAVVYYYRMEDELLGSGSILVQNDHLSMWKISQEELHDIAVSNTARLLPYEFIDIADLFQNMLGVSLDRDSKADPPMYVLTNVEKSYGAVSMIYDSVLEAIAQKLGGDFYILPSSIHECMVIPVAEGIRETELRRMVKEINEEQVAVQEVLGEGVYRYYSRKKRLGMAEEPEEPLLAKGDVGGTSSCGGPIKHPSGLGCRLR